jgi:hypothetical protein
MSGDGEGDLQAILRPLSSLASKSEKAQGKVAPGTWQHAMLEGNVAALRLASALLARQGPAGLTREQLLQAQRSLASMADRTAKAQAAFPPGTSQRTLLANRLNALAAAASAVEAESRRRRGRHGRAT